MSVTLIEPHVKLCVIVQTKCGSDSPDSKQTVDVEGGSCVDATGCSTCVLSERHISEWRTERAALSHITWTTYERATYREIDIHKRASGQERRKRDSSSRHVCQRVCEIRDLSVLGMSRHCIAK